MLAIGNRESVLAKAVGEARFAFGSRLMFLNYVYFIPSIRQNLISISELYRQLFSISFDNNAIIVFHNGLEICRASLEYGLYILRLFESCSFNTEIFRVSNPIFNKKQKVSHDNKMYLRHLRLGHISLDRINRLTRDGHLRELRISTLPIYKSCLESKIT